MGTVSNAYNMSWQEIAREMGISEAYVRKIYNNAVRKLQLKAVVNNLDREAFVDDDHHPIPVITYKEVNHAGSTGPDRGRTWFVLRDHSIPICQYSCSVIRPESCRRCCSAIRRTRSGPCGRACGRRVSTAWWRKTSNRSWAGPLRFCKVPADRLTIWNSRPRLCSSGSARRSWPPWMRPNRVRSASWLR